ncbi:MAG: hypothetical protein K8H88_24390 [Sandaracinaceae bacterium]|nr:hypothetical protein [Sandaracinaceae bacterium]
MDVEIGELETRLTVTDGGDLVESGAADRIARMAARKVIEELERAERKRAERLGSRRVDPSRY